MNQRNRHNRNEERLFLRKLWLPLVLMFFGIAPHFAQIQINFTIDEPSCYAYTNGNITAEPTGGILPYSYLWSNFQAGQTTYGVSAGNYSVTVTDALGMSSSANVTVGQPPLLEVMVEPVGDICLGTDGDLIANVTGGTPPINYNWTTGETTQTITDLLPGYYGVTVTDDNGCKAIHGIVVNKPLTVTVKVTDVLCFAWCDGIVEAMVMGGTGPYTYEWNTGQTVPIVDMLPPGTYTVTVTDSNGCTAEGTGTIGEPDEIEISIDIDDPCNGAANVDVEVMGGISPYTYQWNDDDGNSYSTNQDLQDLAEGYYFLTVTDANGCQQDTFIVISDGVEIVPFPTPEDCEGSNSGSVVIEVPNGIGPLTFFLSNGIVSPDKFIDSLASGTYGVTVVDGAGCSDSTSFEIGGGASFDLDAATTDAGCGNICDGTATANPSGGAAPYTFQWDVNANDQTTQTAINLCPGDYSVTITDSNDCKKDTTLTVGEIPSDLSMTIAVTPTGCDTVCTGTAVIEGLGGTPPYSISWSPDIGNDNGVEITDLCAGDYTVTLTDDNGCTTDGTFTIEESDPLSILIEVTNATCQDSNNGCAEIVSIFPNDNPPYTILWSNGSTDSLNCGLTPGEYSVTVTDANGCTGTVDSIIVGYNSFVDAMFEWQVDDCEGDSISITFTDTSQTDSQNSIISWEWIFSTGLTSNEPSVTITIGVPSVDVTLIVENSAGCMDTLMDSIMISVFNCAVPVQDTTVCQGENLMLDVSCPSDSTLMYSWNPDSLILSGGNSPDVTINTSQPGDFLVWINVSSPVGCDFMDSISVTVIDTSMTIDPNIIDYDQSCDTTEICFTNGNDSLAFSYYTWYFDYPNPDITSNDLEPCYIFPDTGLYTIWLVPNSSCLDTFQFGVQVEETPMAIIDYEKGDCSDTVDVVFYDISTPDSLVVSRKWDFGNGIMSTAMDTTITITDSSQLLCVFLEVTFANGCVKTDSVKIDVDVFIPIFPPDTIISCGPGEKVVLNPDGDSTHIYLWEPGDDLLPIDTFWNPMAMVDDTTTFTVTIDSAHCSVNHQVTVVFAPPMNLMLLPPDPIEICENKDTLLIASADVPVDFAWYNDPTLSGTPLSTESTMMVTVGDSITYYVIATDQYHCQDTASLPVGNYEIIVFIPNEMDICKGEPIEIGIDSLDEDNHIVTWFPQDPNGVFIGDTTVFSLTVTNIQGCEFSDSFQANFVDMDALLNVHPRLDTIVLGDTVHITSTFNPDFEYDWSPVDGLDEFNVCCPIAQPTDSTTYLLEAFDPSNGCIGTGTSTICVISDLCDEPMIFFPDAFTPNGDGLNDILKVEGFNITDVSFTIYNRWGEKVFETHSIDEGWDGTYNGQPAPTDAYAYYLRVFCEFGGQYYKQGNVTVIR